MKVELTLDKVTPELHEIIRYVEKKCMHNLALVSPENIVSGEQLPVMYSAVQVIDPRFPHMDAVAAIRFRGYKDNKPTYKITSHLINNARYRAGSPDYNSKQASQWEKAAKILLDVCKPYEYSDAMMYNIHTLDSYLNDWQHEMTKKVRSVIGYHSTIDTDTFMREIKNLLAIGATFATEIFQKLATETLPIYEESMRRKNMVFNRYHVYLLDDGRVAVSMQKECTHANRYDPKAISTEVYSSYEAVPEPVAGKYALLKMLEKDTKIAEVGIRISDREFYVLDPTTPTGIA